MRKGKKIKADGSLNQQVVQGKADLEKPEPKEITTDGTIYVWEIKLAQQNSDPGPPGS